MFVEYPQSYSPQAHNNRMWRSPKVFAILLSLVLGFLFASALSILSGIFVLAPWLLGFALGFVSTALISVRRTGKTLWGMAILGQLLGVLGIGLLFLNSLI